MRLERAGEFDAFFFSSFCSCPTASFVLSDPKAVATSQRGCLADEFILMLQQR